MMLDALESTGASLRTKATYVNPFDCERKAKRNGNEKFMDFSASDFGSCNLLILVAGLGRKSNLKTDRLSEKSLNDPESSVRQFSRDGIPSAPAALRHQEHFRAELS